MAATARLAGCPIKERRHTSSGSVWHGPVSPLQQPCGETATSPSTGGGFRRKVSLAWSLGASASGRGSLVSPVLRERLLFCLLSTLSSVGEAPGAGGCAAFGGGGAWAPVTCALLASRFCPIFQQEVVTWFRRGQALPFHLPRWLPGAHQASFSSQVKKIVEEPVLKSLDAVVTGVIEVRPLRASCPGPLAVPCPDR